MVDRQPASTSSAPRTAVTVMQSGPGVGVCPFFGRCDGIVLIDPAAGTRDFLRNGDRTSSTLCEVILGARPARLVCGFIGETDKCRLRAAGIDVRLGSCACSVDELIGCFDTLPEA
jgi:predicted Fe-Mo cluster-binding NifX family protein